MPAEASGRVGAAPDPSWERLRLYTDRLCLRTPTPRDAEALYDLFADPEVMHGLGKEPVSALEEARAMIEDGIGGWEPTGSVRSFSRPRRPTGRWSAKPVS